MTVLARHLARVKPNHLTAPACRNAGTVAWMAFLPARLRIRVGRTVAFKIDSNHEPHTFTFGPQAHTPVRSGARWSSRNRAPADRPHRSSTRSEPIQRSVWVTAHPRRCQPRQRLREQRHARYQPAHPNPSEVAERITFTKLGTYYFECVTYPNIDNTIMVTR
jgi:plastocyanin